MPSAESAYVRNPALGQPSRCIAKAVRKCFDSGELPRGRISCRPDRSVFHQDTEENCLSRADQELSRAMASLADMP